jgi:hypothetical protein
MAGSGPLQQRAWCPTSGCYEAAYCILLLRRLGLAIRLVMRSSGRLHNMPENTSSAKADLEREGTRRPSTKVLRSRAKKAGITLLFGIILLIPRLRRLRRRVWAWTLLRVAAGGIGIWLLWSSIRGEAEFKRLTLSAVLLAFAIFLGARPLTKSLDDRARELHALVVLNGGCCVASNLAAPVPGAAIFVSPERLIVTGEAGNPLFEIPMTRLRSLTIHALAQAPGQRSGGFNRELEIQWTLERPLTAHFRYQGFFAQHLAQIAQQTIEGVWKRGLPVLKP